MPQHRKMLEGVLKGHPAFKLVKSVASAREGLKYLQQYEIDLLFLDIEMPGESGLWLANEIKHLPIPVVFVTSHTGYAVQAFEACALDYIIKPIERADVDSLLERLTLRLSKVEHITVEEQLKEVIEQYLSPAPLPQRVFVTVIGGTHILPLDQVMYFISIDRYTHIQMANGDRHVSSKALSTYIDTILVHPDFMRVHRSTIVNKKHVKMIVTDGKQGKNGFEMMNGDVLEISNFKRDEIIAELGR